VTVAELLARGAAGLQAREGLREPRREARFLLARLLGHAETWLAAHPEAEVEEHDAARFAAWIARRDAGEPAYAIVGSCPFWGREFRVTPAVLIPRPETELLVARALSLPLPAAPRTLDVATGSGCVAVTLALELAGAVVVATDLSPAALAVARGNAARHGARVHLASADLADPVRGGWDLAVANLPYVPRDAIDGLTPEVRDWEPRAALDGGADGADLLRALVAELPRLLSPGGWALLELGPGQAGPLAGAASAAGLEEAGRVVDVGGVERVLALRRPGPAQGAR